mgnify:CR=1 FL=1|uniref:Histidine kinase/HSP90-like ATPase domain-containing protein n=1 Tax=viral metagenome TaxID=1070528 RepID=A0A6C0EJU3_9ZZZZ
MTNRETNRNDCRESYISKLKAARSSNYNSYRSIAEFLDNSVDGKSTNITIKLIYDISTPPNLLKIIIIDNGIGIDNIGLTATHGFSRERKDEEGGEFGYGYKLAAINMSDKLTMITNTTQKNYQRATWNQTQMAKDDNYEPYLEKNKSIMKEFKGITNSLTGTVSIFEELLSITKSSICPDSLGNYVQKRYEKFIRDGTIEFNIKTDGYKKEEFYKTIDSKTISLYDHSQCETFTTTLSIYNNNNNKLKFILNGYITEKEERELMLDKVITPGKNGNYRMNDFEDKSYIPNTISHTLVGEIVLNTKNFVLAKMHETTFLPHGKIDILRKNYVITDNSISYVADHGDGYSNYIYHQLNYNTSDLDGYLGTNVNKQNNGIIRDKELYKVLHYMQRKHETKFRKKNKEEAKKLKNDELTNIKSLTTINTKINSLLKEELSNSILEKLKEQITKMNDIDSTGSLCKANKIEFYNLSVLNELKKGKINQLYDNIKQLITLNQKSDLDKIDAFISSIKELDPSSNITSSMNIDLDVIYREHKTKLENDTLQQLYNDFNELITQNINESNLSKLKDIIANIKKLDPTGIISNSFNENFSSINGKYNVRVELLNNELKLTDLTQKYNDINTLIHKIPTASILDELKKLINSIKNIDPDGTVSENITCQHPAFNTLDDIYQNQLSALKQSNYTIGKKNIEKIYNDIDKLIKLTPVQSELPTLKSLINDIKNQDPNGDIYKTLSIDLKFNSIDDIYTQYAITLKSNRIQQLYSDFNNFCLETITADNLSKLENNITHIRRLDPLGDVSATLNFDALFKSFDDMFQKRTTLFKISELKKLYVEIAEIIDSSSEPTEFTLNKLKNIISSIKTLDPNGTLHKNVTFPYNQLDLLYSNQLKIFNKAQIEWKTSIYLGLCECSDNGIKLKDNKITFKFGYTTQDIIKRDSGGDYSKIGWRRIISSFINKDGTIKEGQQIKAEKDLYAKLSSLNSITWLKKTTGTIESKEYFTINKDCYFNVIDIFNEISLEYRPEIGDIFN